MKAKEIPFKDRGPGVKLKMGSYETNNRLKYPRMDDYRSWAKRFLNSDLVKDYDAYLWGSFPDRRTKDIDIILSKGQGELLKPSEMEEISIANLEESVGKNNILVDLGFSEQRIHPFERYMQIYNDTGEVTPTTGMLFGDKWYRDGKLWKDRSLGLKGLDGEKGPSDNIGNQMWKVFGAQPYHKLLRAIDEGDQSYAGKPLKIKRKGKGFV